MFTGDTIIFRCNFDVKLAFVSEEKRVGYLGLTQLLDENTEVLMCLGGIPFPIHETNHWFILYLYCFNGWLAVFPVFLR